MGIKYTGTTCVRQWRRSGTFIDFDPISLLILEFP